jgi:hypothetical protein
MTALYKVDRVSKVAKQIRQLHQKLATRVGRENFVNALSTLHEKLQNSLDQIGEPIHNTRRRGGVVHCGPFAPFWVRFALYEEEKVVLLLELRALPKSYLD